MHNRFFYSAIIAVGVLVPAILSLHGRAVPPPPSTPLADTHAAIEDYLYSQLRQHGQIKEPKLPISIYVQKVQGRKLVNPVFKRKDRNGQIDWVAHARTAELAVLVDQRLILVHMDQVMVLGENGSRAFVEEKSFVLDLPKGVGQE